MTAIDRAIEYIGIAKQIVAESFGGCITYEDIDGFGKNNSYNFSDRNAKTNFISLILLNMY